MTLTEILSDPVRRPPVIRDAASLVESEVASKGGLGGAALRAGFGAMKKVKQGILEEALELLLPRFAPVLDPWWERAVGSGDAPGFFDRHRVEIAESLLAVTDARAKVARNRVLIKVYTSLRPTAHAHTAAAVPKLPALIARHLPG